MACDGVPRSRRALLARSQLDLSRVAWHKAIASLRNHDLICQSGLLRARYWLADPALCLSTNQSHETMTQSLGCEAKTTEGHYPKSRPTAVTGPDQQPKVDDLVLDILSELLDSPARTASSPTESGVSTSSIVESPSTADHQQSGFRLNLGHDNRNLSLPYNPADFTKEQVIAILNSKALEVIDRVNQGGALWVVGDIQIKSMLAPLHAGGARFSFAPSGGRATNRRPAWWWHPKTDGRK